MKTTLFSIGCLTASAFFSPLVFAQSYTVKPDWLGYEHAQKIPLGSAAYTLAMGDLNGDGFADFSMSSLPDVLVVLSTGAETYAAPVSYTATLNWIETGTIHGDFDRDGNLDLAFLTPSASLGTNNFDLHVLSNLGDGTFVPAGVFPVLRQVRAGEFFYALNWLVADMNGDGVDDLVISTYSNLGNPDGFVSIILNTTPTGGALSFADAINIPTIRGAGNAMIAADFDNDQDLDLALSQTSDATVTIFLNDSSGISGSFSSLNVGGGNNFGTAHMAAGDMNQDGFVDIVHLSPGRLGVDTNTLKVLLNLDGGSNPIDAGTFRKDSERPIGPNPTLEKSGRVLLADLDLDGKFDIAGGFGGTSGFIQVIPGIGPPASLGHGTDQRKLFGCDLDSDGDFDLVALSEVFPGELSILRNRGKRTILRR